MAAHEPTERLTFLVGAPPPPDRSQRRLQPVPPAPAPVAEEPAEPGINPALLRRAQARIRRASLIREQLGAAAPPLYFVDFMAVEDLAADIGLDAAVAQIAERDERTADAVLDSWQPAVRR